MLIREQGGFPLKHTKDCSLKIGGPKVRWLVTSKLEDGRG
jgi:hypothetical protein